MTIEGIVKDKKTQKNLIGANVFIVGTSIGASTNTEGKYLLKNIKPGSYKVKASYIGYQAVEVDIDVTPTENMTQDFELSYVSLQGEAIEVTAQARGQIDAINEQIKAKSIKNIVSSDRIQELPDANAAETVARIPGVSIRREGGEGNKVIIRGLSPKYNKVMVDGTNLASTDPDNRSTDLSMISQYMLEGIEVTKAGTPDQEGDVLGGTVNFKLKKAPSGLHGNFVTQGMQNGLQETNNDYKLVGSISNRFFGDRLGVLVSLDTEKRNRSSHNLRSSYQNSTSRIGLHKSPDD
ncbi:MAG: carboxypeptidase-like regulatory domain-containing protein [Candidatus Neomarinimicrobiota bacterium]